MKKKILFLSPHLDDVVFSCGDYIVNMERNSDVDILVVTIFSLASEPKFFSSAARWFHARCKLGDNPMNIRKNEDEHAMNILNVDFIYVDEYECWYRMFEDGKHRYDRVSGLLTVDVSKDLDTICRLKGKIFNLIKKYSINELYVPLGIGRNIDHIITRKAVEENIYRLNNVDVFYYEDMPYVCNSRDCNWEKDLTKNLDKIIVPFSEEEHQLKIKAINCYKSQLDIIWGGKYMMLRHLDSHSNKHLSHSRSVRVWKQV